MSCNHKKATKDGNGWMRCPDCKKQWPTNDAYRKRS